MIVFCGTWAVIVQNQGSPRRRLRMQHYAADVPVAVEHVVIVVRPRATGAVFGRAFEGERT
jgi:hypothetical protein